MIQHILFLDIETVPIQKDIGVDEVSWLYFKKFRKELPENPSIGIMSPIFQDGVVVRNHWEDNAGLSAEFGKIVCVSVGVVSKETGILRIKTVCSRDEKFILKEVSEIMKKMVVLCAHNGKGFDFPFLFRRYLINGLEVPDILVMYGKKPWDIPHIDTMEMWSHMEYKYRCSLDLLAHCFGLSSPKKDMDGSQVSEVYYSMFDDVKSTELPFDKEEAVLKKIGDYCAGDIVTLVNVYCKMKGLPIFTQDKIQVV